MRALLTVYRGSLFILAVGAIPAAIVAARTVEVPRVFREPGEGGPNDSMLAAPLDSLASYVVAHDPFRMSRSPASVPYSSVAIDPGYVAPSPPKPHLVLTGIVWGSQPSAVIEGLPGIEGPRLVGAKEVVGAIRVRRITREDVTLEGMDTTWVLKVRNPW